MKPLTAADRGKLGGIRGSDKLTPEERRERARKAGLACREARGREFYVRLGMRRQGKKVELNGPKPKIGKSPESPAGPGQGVTQ